MLTRFARFTLVGIIGFGVQVMVLTCLVRAGVPVTAATLVAVEAAVLHNFVWHARWTWADRGAPPFGLVRFHLANGLFSLGGNVLITTVLANAGVPLALASLASVAGCAMVNFALAHALVFCVKTWPTFHGHLHQAAGWPFDPAPRFPADRRAFGPATAPRGERGGHPNHRRNRQIILRAMPRGR